MAIIACGLLLAACGGAKAAGARHAPSPAKAPPVTGVAAASAGWPPALAPGPASTARFCSALVDQYRHLQTTAATDTRAGRIALLDDYVAFTPTVVAAAPPAVASAAQLYLTSIAKVLHAYVQAGLDMAKVPVQVGSLLTNAQVSAAGKQVLAFSSQQCHYTIKS